MYDIQKHKTTNKFQTADFGYNTLQIKLGLKK